MRSSTRRVDGKAGRVTYRLALALAAVSLPLVAWNWLRAGTVRARPARVTQAAAAGANQPMKTVQTMVCPLWRTDGSTVAKLHLKNALAVSKLTVLPTLYMDDGMPLPLPGIEMPVSGEVTINLNDAIAAASQTFTGHLSTEGSASLTYIWDGPGHVAASMNLKDLVHSLSFVQACTIAPAPAMGLGMAGDLPGMPQIVNARYLRTQAASDQALGQITLEGLWWKHDPGVRGYFTIVNLTPAAAGARYRVIGAQGESAGWREVTLAPHALGRFAIDPEVRAFGGGIEVAPAADTPDGAIAAAGWLENPQEGFSSSIEFGPLSMAPAMSKPGTGSQPTVPGPVSMAAAGVMLGAPMAANHFPEGTGFIPYGYLRNASSRPLNLALNLNVSMGSMPGVPGSSAGEPMAELGPLPFQLQPGETRQVPLSEMAERLEGKIMAGMAAPPEGLVLNWSASFNGFMGDLLMSTGATDQTGNYVFEVMPQRVAPSAGEQLAYWNTAGANDTMYTLWNPGTEAQDVILSLTTADGQHAYNLPLHLVPGASAMVDLKMLRQEGMPDPQGHLLPEDAWEGSAMLHPAGEPPPGKNGLIPMAKTGPPQMNVIVSMGVFNVVDATCSGCCANCCFYSCPTLGTGYYFIAVGQQDPATMSVEDCSGGRWDCTSYATWSSDPTVLSQGSAGDPQYFQAVGAGVTTLDAWADMEAADPNDPSCSLGCNDAELTAPPLQITVQPVITSISPDAILAGGALNITINGEGFGNSPTVNLPSGFLLSGASYSNTSITGRLAVSTGATLGNNSISVTANQATSQGSNFVADYPADMIVVSDSTVFCENCVVTEGRFIEYQVKTFSGIDAALVNIRESVTTANWTCTTPTTVSITGCGDSDAYTDSNGVFTDEWSVGTDSASPSGCGWDITDHWQWCALSPAKTFGTLMGHIGQFTVTEGGITSTLANKQQIKAGTVINP